MLVHLASQIMSHFCLINDLYTGIPAFYAKVPSIYAEISDFHSDIILLVSIVPVTYEDRSSYDVSSP